MQPADSGSSRQRSATVQRNIFLFLTLFLCAASLYLCYRAIRVMERAVTVMENLDAKIDRAVAGAPAAVEHGRELLSSTEAERLRTEAAAIRDRARGWLSQHAPEVQPQD